MREFKFNKDLVINVQSPTNLLITGYIEPNHNKSNIENRGYEVYDDEFTFEVDINGDISNINTLGFLNIVELTDEFDCIVSDGENDEPDYNSGFYGLALENFTGSVKIAALDDDDNFATKEETFNLLENGEFELGYKYPNIRLIVESDMEVESKYVYFK